MPSPLLWGVMAALLNFLPYIGALATIVVVAAISVVSFDSLGYAMVAPAFVICCNVVEGQIVTPLIVGRRLELNAVAIFIAVAFWSWLWGFIGALIAVPLLVVVKVFCDHFEELQSFGNFLSAQQSDDDDEEDEEEDRPSGVIPEAEAKRRLSGTH
jgi:predicted PurR-regulated permease PerM